MKEKDYIIVSNLTRLRMVVAELCSVVPDHVVGEDGPRKVRETLWGWITTYEALVDNVIVTDEED